MFERFTESARQVVAVAQDEARRLNHSYVGTEHLLLGLVGEREGLAARALEPFGLTVELVRSDVPRIVGRGEELATGQLPFTRPAKKILELALREALTLGHSPQAVPQGGPSALVRGRTSDASLDAIGFSDALLDGAGPTLRTLAGEISGELDRPADSGDLLVLLASIRDGLAARTLISMGIDPGTLARAAAEAREASIRSSLLPASELLAECERVRAEKKAAMTAKDFDRAAQLRGQERRLLEQALVEAERGHRELLAALRRRLGLAAR